LDLEKVPRAPFFRQKADYGTPTTETGKAELPTPVHLPQNLISSQKKLKPPIVFCPSSLLLRGFFK
jgi:hypothetical protein